MSLYVEDAMRVTGLQRPELIVVCAILVRKGIAKGPVDAIEKLANGTITSDFVHSFKENINQE